MKNKAKNCLIPSELLKRQLPLHEVWDALHLTVCDVLELGLSVC